ncbi:oxygen-independent coproporphyrinogen-3 oxidase [Oikeobacillus pervagus]|uniref:Heme chaperone HemW n=1 Tax=Oikeobacillus pervagus TaxID=1325931 RepID=A0AAJ1T287_9BACI|nr:radical SAM family heme chaperone HemW [Oikeobacillus pervagus]MDQ0213936.1 oxygen-independent coproporphyrinogen-3 oxidase [Oikeobacillus pervagus]
MITSAYIHIPFCHHICHYCDFNKVFYKDQPVDEYLHALRKEMELTMEHFPTKELKTIFVGGGTPTALSRKQLEMLCSHIRSSLPFSEGEFTFEANPGELTVDKIKVLKEYGVNRISLGVQSFHDELLKKIGRAHTRKDVFATIDGLQSAGFENISVDLMYALPGQTLDDFRETLQTAFTLELPHYSAYSLIIEPKTIFYNLMQKGKLPLPKEEVEARMYELVMDQMEKHHLHQYEISNFAKRGFESRHNSVYWNNDEYYGFGAGAHSYIKGKRKSNFGPLKKYITPLKKEGQLPVFQEHLQTVEEKMEEEMFLGLRKTEGVSIQHFRKKFGESPMHIFENQIAEAIRKELLEKNEDSIRLTKEGRFLGNEVFQMFLMN